MYRKRTVIGMLAAVVFLFAVVSRAAATIADWSYEFSCTTTALHLGTRTGALGSIDAYDRLAPEIWIDPPIVLVWSDLGRTRLDVDYRQPLSPGRTKTWTIEAERVKPIFFPMAYAFSWSPGSAVAPTDGPPHAWTASLRLTGIPFGSPYSGPTSWDLTGGKSGYASLPMYWMGSGTPVYTFEFSVTAVPEPGAFVALCCGLGGLAFLRRH